jgi:two-component system, NarL family, nitrate/nitrite response regulator NarL
VTPLNNSLGNKVRVLLVEKDSIFRSALKLLLESGRTIQIVKQIGDVDAYLKSTELSNLVADPPNVILLSAPHNCLEGIEKITQLRKTFPKSKVLLLIGQCEQSNLQRAVILGISGIVTQGQTQDILVRAVEKIANGEIWIDRALMAQALSEFTAEKIDERDYERQKIRSLTPRELQIVHTIGDGFSNREITEKLRISESTVRHHLSSIYSKLDVKDRLGLVIYSYKHELISNANANSHTS